MPLIRHETLITAIAAAGRDCDQVLNFNRVLQSESVFR